LNTRRSGQTFSFQMKKMELLVAAIVMGSIGLAAAMPRRGPFNDACPITGKEIARDKTSDVKVGFCCANCKGKFDRDPAAGLLKVEKVPNDTCPLSGRAIGDAVSTVTVAFCSGDCKEKFDKEPAKYMKAVKPAKKDGK